MAKKSAGLLLFRRTSPLLEVLLVHPGGPFWAKKDLGAWSIPKGELEDGEDPLLAAQREFTEETGWPAPDGPAIPLRGVRQPGGKDVLAWAVEADVDPRQLLSNTFSLEWPPRSGKRRDFPEVDRAAWLTLAEAREKILPGQLDLLAQLAEHLRGATPRAAG